jgi:hypothetical protein
MIATAAPFAPAAATISGTAAGGAAITTMSGTSARSIACNLRAGGFGGSLHIVNPNYEYIDGLSTVNSVEAI